MGSVEVVRNPAEPVFSAGDISIDTSWAAPSEAEQRERGLWQAPSIVRASGMGWVYVLDRMAHHVYGIRSTNGAWDRTIGREGSGPGEFERPFGLAVLEDSVVVGNGGNATLEIFSASGKYGRSIRIGAMGFSVDALSSGSFLVLSLVGSDGGWTMVDRDGSAVPVQWPEPVTDKSAASDCFRTAAASERLVRMACARFALMVVDTAGRLLREILVRGTPVSPDEEALGLHLANARKIMAQSGFPNSRIERQLQRQRERLQPVPRFRSIRYDPEAQRYAVLEQTPTDLGGGPATVHFFDRSGVFLATKRFPRRWVGFDMRGNRIYALVQDSATGLVRLIAYSLIFPPLST